jgi:hypothetical protein
MAGHLVAPTGQMIARGGFMATDFGDRGIVPAEASSPRAVTRGWTPETDALIQQLTQIERTDVTGDVSSVLRQLGMTLQEFQRGIISSQTAFPVRENLEAEAKILVPLDTPVRNMIPRTPGAGTATQWRQATSLGGGYGTSVDQPGGVSNIRAFFAEQGAPADHATVYANQSKGYKLLGSFGSVTGFAAASGGMAPE